jgi:hypothetical protein
MGVQENVDYNKFPKQGEFLGRSVRVTFHYNSHTITGTIIRNDIESPNLTIIQLTDGRTILDSECQYQPVRVD